MRRASTLGHRIGAVSDRVQPVLQDKKGANLWPKITATATWKSLGESAKILLAGFHEQNKVYTFNSPTEAMKAARKSVKTFESESKTSPEGMGFVDLSTHGPDKDFARYVKHQVESALERIGKTSHPSKKKLAKAVEELADMALYWAKKLDFTALGTRGLIERPADVWWLQESKPTGIRVAEYLEDDLRKIWKKVETAEGGGNVPKATVPEWGGQTHGGQGTWCSARFSPGRTWAAGSSPGGSIGQGPAWEKMAVHAGIPGGTPLGQSTLYIRGHLLNDHLGGPGLPYNLVALAGHAGPDTPSANAKHHTDLEEQLKKTVSILLNWGGRSPSQEQPLSVRYRIEAVWGNHSRSQRGVVEKAARIVASIENKRSKWGLGTSATVLDLRNRLVDGNGKKDSYLWDTIHDAVNAVCDYRVRNEMPLARLAELMAANARLWTWEDANVPLRLDTRVSVERPAQSGTDTKEYRTRIPNDLPDEASRPLVRQWEL